ncbi:hypothetical protein BST95_04960 [Halioglobus japonicus]|uniref:AraC family transcriptional regulator n=1 Tax=Halioglobus japonicus TaxID=930805 RepID=A0AAP8MD53_9GAMM|nr:AraC family transcriptional regulator [Halioglobus japonicus]AQA17682.1 hypothetical protein BST95_04960 [Halioglobus japonicus]PLW85630.1 AraC family transcriptional regulator [Halioglobus japonicus]GHD16639.1 transcriptional regulator [Halioglobus japonicus]
MEISTVPAVFVRALLHGATLKGCDIEAALEQLDISREVVDGARARIPAAQYSALVDLISAELNDEYCGLVEQPSRPGTFALICYACIHAPTLGAFIERATPFHSVTTDCSVTSVEVVDGIAHYVFAPLGDDSEPQRLLVLSFLAIIHRLASWLIGQNIPLESASFAHPRPEHAAAYNLLYRAPIHFSRNRNCISFSANYLDAPIVRSEADLEAFLKIPGAQLMASPDERNSHVAKVTQLIKPSVADEFPDFEWVASQLHSTTGTLRRRLREEGTSYQQLKDDLRRDTAIYNLNRGVMSIEEVAESIGFSEPTSFFRAFKRWTGVTPRAYTAREKKS